MKRGMRRRVTPAERWRVPDECCTARRDCIGVSLALAVGLLATPRVALHAQSAAALRVAAVAPAPPARTRFAAPRLPRGIPPECQPWVGWGVALGATAGLTWGIVEIARAPHDTRPFMIVMSPVLLLLPTLAGGALGALTGEVACGIRYSGTDGSAVSASW